MPAAIANVARSRSKLKVDDRATLAAIDVVLAWCDQERITVEFKRKIDDATGGWYWYRERRIVVSSRMKLQHRLWVLLHECGHHLVAEADAAIGKSSEERTHGAVVQSGDPRVDSFLRRIAEFDEEFEAWKRGRALAERLGVRLDERSWQRFQGRCLRVYLKQLARVHLRSTTKKKESTIDVPEPAAQEADRTATVRDAVEVP